MDRISAIVLAAGMSTRMGRLKQLLPLGDRLVVQRVADAACSCIDRVVVVLGHEAAAVGAALAGRPVECVVNADYAAGMLSSFRCGLEAAGEADGYLLCLGDQPGIGPQVIRALLNAAQKTDKGLLIPVHCGRRGHPVLIGARYLPEINALPPEGGLKPVTRGHPEDTAEIVLDDQAVLEDMDTPDDYRRHLGRYADR